MSDMVLVARKYSQLRQAIKLLREMGTTETDDYEIFMTGDTISFRFVYF